VQIIFNRCDIQTPVLLHYEEWNILIHKTPFLMRSSTGITSFQKQSGFFI